LRFSGSGVEEVGIVDAVSGSVETGLKPGDEIIPIDPRYFLPAEVASMRGDAAAAREALGWTPQTTARELCTEMGTRDLETARRHAPITPHGFSTSIIKESLYGSHQETPGHSRSSCEKMSPGTAGWSGPQLSGNCRRRAGRRSSAPAA